MGRETNLGRKLVLHKVSFPQLRKEKDEFVIVEIIELKDVKDAWSGEIVKDGGWKAKSEDGRFFFCNWGTFPSDSMTPAWMWIEADENYTKYIKDWYDITYVRGASKLPSELKDNGIVDYCSKHKLIYEIDRSMFGQDGPSCFDCWLEFKYPEKGDRTYQTVEEGNWNGWD